MTLAFKILIFTIALSTSTGTSDNNLPRHVTLHIPNAFLHPCKLVDLECFKGLWQNAIPYFSEGVKELGLDSLDPLQLRNVNIKLPNVFEVNLIKGIMKGYRTCVVDKYKWTYIKKQNLGANIDFHCNITIKGRYKAKALTNIVPGLPSEGILKGDGNAKITLPNLKLKFILDLNVTTNVNGQKILSLNTPINFKHKVKEPVTFKVTNMYLENEDISELTTNLLNAGWRYVITNFGQPFFREAMNIIGDIERAFFSVVPLSEYIEDDLDEYVL